MKVSSVFIVVAAFALSSEAVILGQPWATAPYMVRVQYLTQVQAGGQGGGTIISHRHILTSAFVLTPNFITLNIFIGGVTRMTQRPVFPQARILHPQYQQNPRLNDIGIIFLTNDLPFDRFVQPIALVPMNQFRPLDNEQGTVLGFGGFPGNTNADLQAGFMRVSTAGRCGPRYPTHLVLQQFCAEDVRQRTDICSDDIGGPFITLERGVEVLVGISSIHVCQVNTAVAIEPSLFTRVSGYRAWINEQTQV